MPSRLKMQHSIHSKCKVHFGFTKLLKPKIANHFYLSLQLSQACTPHLFHGTGFGLRGLFCRSRPPTSLPSQFLLLYAIHYAVSVGTNNYIHYYKQHCHAVREGTIHPTLPGTVRPMHAAKAKSISLQHKGVFKW